MNYLLSVIEIDFIKVFETLGIPVGGLIVITYVLMAEKRQATNMLKSHREERKEWFSTQQNIENSNIAALISIKDSNERLQDRNIKALDEFKTANHNIQERNICALEELTEAIKNSKK